VPFEAKTSNVFKCQLDQERRRRESEIEGRKTMALGRIYVSQYSDERAGGEGRSGNDNYVWVLKWDFNTHINRCSVEADGEPMVGGKARAVSLPRKLAKKARDTRSHKYRRSRELQRHKAERIPPLNCSRRSITGAASASTLLFSSSSLIE
jgi:hypothetical protein